MTLFERPRAIRIRTSRSRGVRSSTSAGAPPPWAISSTIAGGDRGRERRVAVVGGADRAHELGRLDVLEQVAGGARAQRREQLVVVAEAREHDHAGARAGLAQALERADAVQARHHEVEQDHVGVGARGGVHGDLAVARLGHDLDVVLEVEERAQPLADHRVVVGEQDADHAGISSRTVVPSPSVGGDLQRPAELGRALLHRRQPEPLPAHLRAVGIEAAAVVGDLQDEALLEPCSAPRCASAPAWRSALPSASWAIRSTCVAGLGRRAGARRSASELDRAARPRAAAPRRACAARSPALRPPATRAAARRRPRAAPPSRRARARRRA